jgi:hypothetical protein
MRLMEDVMKAGAFLAGLISLSAVGGAHAAVLFSDNFQTNLSQWQTPGTGVIAAAPVGGGNALKFNALGSGGDLFSFPIAGTGAGTYALSFQYLGTCARGGCGGYVGLAPGSTTITSPLTGDAWLASDTPAAYFTPFVFSSNGAWTSVNVVFSVTTAAQFGLKLEDFVGSGGVAGDAYFRNLTLTSGVPEPSTWAMMLIGFAGLGFAARRRTKAAAASA